MFNCHTGFKIAVQAPVGSAPFIVVPTEQVNAVDQLLFDKGIGHTLGNRLTEREDREQVIHVGKLWDLQQIQDALDSVQ